MFLLLFFIFFPQIVICLHKGMLHELEFFLFDDENVNTKVAQNGSLPEVKRGTNNTVIYFCYYTPITCGKLLSLNFHCSALHVKEIAVNFVIIFQSKFITIIKILKQTNYFRLWRWRRKHDTSGKKCDQKLRFV